MHKFQYVKATVCGVLWALVFWFLPVIIMAIFLKPETVGLASTRLFVLAILISIALTYFEILPGTRRTKIKARPKNESPSDSPEGNTSVPSPFEIEKAEGPVSEFASRPDAFAAINSATERVTTNTAALRPRLFKFVGGAFQWCNSNKVTSISLAVATLFACMNTPNESQFTQQYLSLQKSGPDYGSFAAKLCDTAISAKFGTSLGACGLLYEALKDSRPPVNEYHYYGIYSTFYVKDVTSKKVLFMCSGFPIGGASCSLPRN